MVAVRAFSFCSVVAVHSYTVVVRACMHAFLWVEGIALNDQPTSSHRDTLEMYSASVEKVDYALVIEWMLCLGGAYLMLSLTGVL